MKTKTFLRRGAEACLRGGIRALAFVLFRPLRLYTSEKARREAFAQPCVLISNHVRGLDGALIQALLPGVPIYSLVAKDILDGSPALRRFLSFCRTIPVDREHPSLSWLRESRKRLREGSCVYLCPEGRCSRTKVMQPFKPGFVTLAASAGVPVVPVYHNGAYNCFFGERFRMIVGEPFVPTPPPAGLAESEMLRETHRIEDIMRGLAQKLNG